MRLIDADALEKIIDDLSKRGWTDWAKSVRKVIDEQPTIDAVPGVYCKDCKHLDKASRFCFICMDWVKDTWFCRVGERRMNDEQQT